MRRIIFSFAILSAISAVFFMPSAASATTGSIDGTSHTAKLCNSVAGNGDCHLYTRVNWKPVADPSWIPVVVNDTILTGYIWSEQFGVIKLNPTSPDPIVPGCSASHVTMTPNNTGILFGCGWGSSSSWVNFHPTNGGVSINTTTGEFSGYAWISGAGWMLFDCSGGAGSDGCVKTDWRPTAGTATTTTGGNGRGGGTTGTGSTGTTGTTTSGTTTSGTTTSGTTTSGTTTSGTTTSGTTTSGTTTTGTSTSGTTTTGTGTTGLGGTTGGSTTGIGGGTTGGGSTGGSSGGTTTGGGGGGGCIEYEGEDLLGKVVGQVKNTYCETTTTVKKTYDTLKTIFTSKNGNIATTAIATGGVIAGASLTIASQLFLNPLSFGEIFLIPARLWSLLMAALGLKKRRRPWGTVYDSITKQPLDPAYVTLRTMEGKEITSSITDLDGRFGFVVPEPGHYTIYAQKTNYVFPSQKLVGYDHDELYRDLYFGEHFYVANAGDVVIKNIPMDPEKFDWNEFAKKQQNLMKFYSKRDKILRHLSDIFFGIGFIVASIAVIFAPKTYNIVIFCLYVVLFFIRKHGAHSRPYGDITDFATGNPISYGIIRVSSAATGVEVMHRIADSKGRYYALLPNGEYKVRIDRKLPDGKYQTIGKDMPATVKNGYLSKTFIIDTSNLPTTLPPEVPPTPPTTPVTPIAPTPAPVAPAPAPVAATAAPIISTPTTAAPTPVVAAPAPIMPTASPVSAPTQSLPSVTPAELPPVPSYPAFPAPDAHTPPENLPVPPTEG